MPADTYSSFSGPPGLGKRRSYISPSKQKRDHQRAKCHFEKVKAFEAKAKFNVRKNSLAIRCFEQWLFALSGMDVGFGSYAKNMVKGAITTFGGRHRDVLPLPRADASHVAWGCIVPHGAANVFIDMVNVTAAGLNWLYNGGRGSRIPHQPTSLHKHVFATILDKLGRIAMVIDETGCGFELPDICGCFDRLTKSSMNNKPQDLFAESIDLLQTCAFLDPMSTLHEDHASTLNDATRLFPQGVEGLPKHVEFSGKCREEYLKLVSKQLRAEKVVLCRSVRASAGVFPVGKKSSSRQREVWNGSAITSAAVKAPHPPLLGNPAALTELHGNEDRRIYVSGRDASIFFDQLRLPEHLREYMGRPYIRAGELCKSRLGVEYGFDLDDLRSYIHEGGAQVLEDSDVLVPLSCAWPMGFGWSSYVAQSYMVDCVKAAGYTNDDFITEEGALTQDPNEGISVATDDVLHFVRCSDSEAKHWCPLRQLDNVFQERGLMSNETKTFDMLLSATCLGVELLDGTHLGPKGDRLVNLICACCDLMMHKWCSPEQLGSLLGMLHWNDLLSRPLLSCFHSVYGFSLQDPQQLKQRLPDKALSEIILNISLMGFWSVDLGRPWLPMIPASDASASFGYGLSFCHSTPEVVRSAARHAAIQHHHFRLQRDVDDAEEKERTGACFRLPHSARSFKTILSVRAKSKAHSGLLEARAAGLGINRIARKAAWHRHRVLFLVDAQVVLGCLQKGRSSAITLRRAVSRICATMLAGDLKVRWGYLPSESNPADRPSRGKTRTTARSKFLKPRKGLSRDEKVYHRLRKMVTRRGLSIDSSDFSDLWSTRRTF